MNRQIRSFLLITFVVAFMFAANIACNTKEKTDRYSGSASCIDCHEDFYKLWSTSHHGLAMQPVTQNFIKNGISEQAEKICIENAFYLALLTDTGLFISEHKNDTNVVYQATWALGGKNIYYFLTPFEKGRLQTLPLAYNVSTGNWYNNPESVVRNFSHETFNLPDDEAISWKDPQYTFNTSCYNCHVSQLTNHYNIENNSYKTLWKEPGINCETCHGPAEEHVKTALKAEKKGIELKELKLVSTSGFTPAQHNASCGSCHAKMRTLTSSYFPGDPFFDHFDLITLENIDFYPDGRDLGENYTMTGWYMNPCVKKSDLHCVTCHTSSGRYRYKNDDLHEANKACTQCHSDKAKQFEYHSRHALSEGSPRCTDCHMPMTTFGHMTRSDHSFRPPMPKASIEFGSPNACNLCHTDKDAHWSQNQLEQNGKDKGHQEATLQAGRLLVEARNGNWQNLDKIKLAIKENVYGEIYTTSFLRLLSTCPDTSLKTTALTALQSRSPLVKSSAVQCLAGFTGEKVKIALIHAASDSFRLVRLSAALSLSQFDTTHFTPEEKHIFQNVSQEYMQSLLNRPDDWRAHFNLGNYYTNMGEPIKAIEAYETAHKIYPDVIEPLVNSSLLYAQTNNLSKARSYLEEALKVDSINEAVNFNYGLLLAQTGYFDQAREALQKVLKVNNKNAAAAYNLAILIAPDNLDEACRLSKNAMDTEKENMNYAYTHAYYLYKNNLEKDAIKVLENLLSKNPGYFQANDLLQLIKQKE